jgi:histidine ammonia-lyase
MALTDLTSISERRIYQLMSGRRGLPDFLARDPGVDSGLMVWQYTAAALVNESKLLSTPSSVDTIMTCQLQEDHVSMGGTGALKIQKVLDNLETVVAIELVAACAAVDFNEGLQLSSATQPIHDAFRRISPGISGDRLMGADISAAQAFLRDSPVVHAALQPLVQVNFGWGGSRGSG